RLLELLQCAGAGLRHDFFALREGALEPARLTLAGGVDSLVAPLHLSGNVVIGVDNLRRRVQVDDRDAVELDTQTVRAVAVTGRLHALQRLGLELAALD